MDFPTFDPHPILEANGRVLAGLPGWRADLEAIRAETSDARAAKRWLQEHRGLRASAAELVGCLAHGEAWEFVDPLAYSAWAEAQAESLFSGRRAAARPALRALAAEARALGPDVRICPLKTHIAFLRGARVFARVKPLTSGRLSIEAVSGEGLEASYHALGTP